MTPLLTISIAIGILGILYLIRPTYTIKQKAKLGVAFAKPVYSDEKGTKLLVAPKLDLQGKPDYIFQKRLTKRLIPLEIKSGKVKADEPYLGDLMQLVTYFLIIEEIYGKKPPYGKLVYSNKTFKIRNTYRLRKQCKTQMKRMRQMLRGKGNIEAEPSYVKCRNCICAQTVCEFKGEKT